jgi:hypothetical protein
MAPDPPVSNPVETLAQLAGEVLGWKALLGTASPSCGPRTGGTSRASEQLRAHVALRASRAPVARPGVQQNHRDRAWVPSRQIRLVHLSLMPSTLWIVGRISLGRPVARMKLVRHLGSRILGIPGNG